MNDSISRRRLLAYLAGGTAALAGCNSGGSRTTTETTNPPTSPPGTTTTATESPTATEEGTETDTEEHWEIDPVEHDRLVGAQYLLWFMGEDGVPNHRSSGWTSYSPGTPVLGEYRSENEEVINQHIKWAREHGINWFSTIWTPADPADDVLRNHFTEAELFPEIDFSIEHYLTEGQYTADGRHTFDFDREANRRQLRQNLQYLSDHFFGTDSYLRIDDRPVLQLNDMNEVVGDIEGAIRDAETAIGEDLYVIGGTSLSREPRRSNRALVEGFDAAVDHILFPGFPVEGFNDHVEMRYKQWRIATQDRGIDFIPTVLPGWTDEAKPWMDIDPDLPRDLARFRDLCDTALDYLDPDIDAIYIDSFNEWPEFNNVEPGDSYGTAYLDVVRDELARGQADPFDVAAHVPLDLTYSDTVVPAERNPESSDDRELAFFLDELTALDGDTTVAQYDAGPTGQALPVFVTGAYSPSEGDGFRSGGGRWLGGPSRSTRMYLGPNIESATELVFTGRPIDRDITAQVHQDGEPVGEIAFDDGMGDYRIPLTTEG